MQIPAGIGPERLDVAIVALRFATEESIAAGRSRNIEATSGRLRRGNSQLIELKLLEFGSDEVAVGINVREIAKTVGGGDRELRGVVEPRIPEPALPMHFEICDEGVPVGNRTPAGPGVEIDAAQSKRRRNQSCAGDVGGGHNAVGHLLRIEGLPVQSELSIKFSGAPSTQDASDSRLVCI